MTTTQSRIAYYRTTFTQEPRAYCDCCATVWAYWEPSDLTEHAETCQCQNTNHQHHKDTHR